jgi:hypothetical protein
VYINKPSKPVIKFALQASAFVWLLVSLLGLPGFRSLMDSHRNDRLAQTQDIPAIYFCPLVLNRWSPPPTLLISEVLFDPLGFEPAAEWIEVYNYGRQEVVLSDYKIGDAAEEGGHEGMYIFPPGAAISSEEAIIITPDAHGFELTYGFKPDFELYDTQPEVPDMIRDTDWAKGSLSLSNSGDEVLLLSLLGSPIDLVSWGDSSYAFSPPVPVVIEGHSIERYPPYVDTNSKDDWRDQSLPSPGKVDLTPIPTSTPLPSTATATPTSSSPPSPTITITPTPTGTPLPITHLLISEVLFNPFDLEPQNEWIEIYNPTMGSIDLTDYKIGDEESKGGGEGMLQFPSGAGILPDERIVIARNAIYFHTYYGSLPDFEIEDSNPNVPNMVIYSSWATENLNMDNIGDEVLILGIGDILIDAISWGTSTWAFDPPCLPVAEGHSLEREPVNVDTDTADDWQDQTLPNPGCPPCLLK